MLCNLQVDCFSKLDTDNEADFDFDDLEVTTEAGHGLGLSHILPQNYTAVQKPRAWEDSPEFETMEDDSKKTSSFHRNLDVSEYRDVCKALF